MLYIILVSPHTFDIGFLYVQQCDIAGADPGFSEGGARIRSYMGYLILLSTKTSDNARLQCFKLRIFMTFKKVQI